MTSSKVTVRFEARSAKAVPTVGQLKSIRVNGHIERMRVIEVQCAERWIDRAWSDGRYVVYCGEVTYVPHG